MTPAPAPTQRLAYAVDELPAVIGLGRSSIAKIIASGALPARKVGTRTLILREDVEKFLRSLPVQGAGE